MIGSTLSRMAAAEKLSVPQLQRAIQDGTIPAYVGIPLLQEKIKMEQQARAAMAGAQQGKPPTVADQVMQQAAAEEMQGGVDQLPYNAPAMATGGIVAFADGGDADEYADAIEEQEEDKRRASKMRKIMALGELPEGANAMAASNMSYGDVAGGKLAADKSAGAYKGITGDHKYKDMIQAEAKKAGLDPEYALKIAMIESGGLKNPEAVRSKAGAIGIMQLMPATAKGLGVENPEDPAQNIRGGVSMLKRLVDKYGDYELAGAAYNAGEGRVDRALRSGKGLAGLPSETQGYMSKIRGMAEGGYTGPEGSDAVKVLLAMNQPEEKNAFDSPVIRHIAGQKVGQEDFDKYYGSPNAFDSPAIRHVAGLPPPKNMASGGIAGYAGDDGSLVSEEDWANTGGVYTPEGEGQLSRLWSKAKRATGFGYMLPESERGWSPEEKVVPPTGAAAQVRRADNAIAKSTPASVQKQTAPVSTDMSKYQNDPNYIEALTGKQPGASAQQTKPAAENFYDKWMQEQMGKEGKRAEQADQDKWLSVLAAGLGMMGGTSPYAAANIGQGAMAGLSNYAQARKQAAAQEAADAKNMLTAQRYKSEDELAKAQLANQEKYRKQDVETRAAAAASADAARIQTAFREYDKEQISMIEKQFGTLLTPQAKAAVAAFRSSPEYITARNKAFPDLPALSASASTALPQGVIVRPRP